MFILSRVFLIQLCLSAVLLAGTSPQPHGAVETKSKISERSFVRIIATNQGYEFLRPWVKRPPYTRRGLGCVLPGEQILITAELVLQNTYVELENIDTGEKCPAEIETIDYQANLALLKPSRSDFLKNSIPLQLSQGAKVGDQAQIIQLETNNSLATTEATISTITVSNYPIDPLGLLVFRLSVPLQQRDGSYVLPAMRNDKLLGLVMRYDVRSQTADLIPPEIIEHFLTDAKAGKKGGFSRLGLSCTDLRDPQLRRYLGIDQNGGVFVDGVSPESPAAKAGIQEGDVILAVKGHALDGDGNFQHPAYGRLPFSYLATVEAHSGDKIPFEIWRKGKVQTLIVEAQTRNPADMKVPSIVFESAPKYLVAGGLVFQELTLPYLREWGPNWQKTAPQRLVYMDAFQDELPAEQKKVVFLSRVLPSPSVLGYEQLDNLVVKSVNDKSIHSLADLAEALKHPLNGFDKIETEEDPGVIYLDPKEVEKEAEALKAHYGIPTLQNL